VKEVSQPSEDLLRKLRALKAKADDPSVTEAESLAYAAKVAELLAQHGLEEAQLVVEEQTGIGHEDYISSINNWSTSPHRRMLAVAVCELYMVDVLISTYKDVPWTLVGRKHNIFMVKEMTDYLIKTTIRLSNLHGRANPGSNVISFRRGCFLRLTERLSAMRDEKEAKRPQYTSQGQPRNLPALYENERKLTDGYIKKHFPDTVEGKYGPRLGRDYGEDAWAGYKAADAIGLDQQVGGGRSNHLLGNPRKNKT
jgi:hypothetical protein